MLTSRTLGFRSLPKLTNTWRRLNSTYEPPTAPKSNRHGSFYRTFGSPVIKNFLIALCTFQAIYWPWLKLESIEMKKKGDSELRMAEGNLRSITSDG
ncbi:uncharacterized protein LTR77_002221 [Saxophila tyrrhenica]|uniref:Uncharacterized protein n=1 Tax=Saxophila tyrrhenica TaxID=1690608 RepID=A0AAV9PIJ9_9PEZI|nr:hypothetical protein LTR77_002221 [Saxophila tyrrhenica]